MVSGWSLCSSHNLQVGYCIRWQMEKKEFSIVPGNLAGWHCDTFVILRRCPCEPSTPQCAHM